MTLLSPLSLRRRPGGAAVLALALGALLSGCASMSEDECRRADWQERGVRDGRDGYTQAHLDEHREACGKAGVRPDAAKWQAGWSQGVREYCTPRSAWNAGAANRTYTGACSHLDEDGFLKQYRLGKTVYETRQALAGNQREINNLESEINKATTKDEDRRRLRESVRRLDGERQRLRRQLDTLEQTKPQS